MDSCQLIDSIELPLKSFGNFYTALRHALQNGLDEYLEKYLVINPADWPAQFYTRQIVYNPPDNAPECIKNIITMIGALHVSLNGRENPILIFITFFKALYQGVFGENRKPLANKPKPWRISLVADITCGGWTLIRRSVFLAFGSSKDIQYLALVNLLDNYLPTALSIYSVVFKSNNLEQYMYAMLRIWIMFFCFKRRHYNKAPLVWLSNVLYWQESDHPIFQLLMECLQVDDEYPVENFHSILRGQTNDYSSPDDIQRKAREINANKNVLRQFQTHFVPPKSSTYNHNQLRILKLKSSEYLASIFKDIFLHPHQAQQLPRTPRQSKDVTKWLLPSLFGQTVVTNKVLPFGFQSPGKEPDPNR